MGAIAAPLIGAVATIGSSLMQSAPDTPSMPEAKPEPAAPKATADVMKSAETQQEAAAGKKTSALKGLRIARSLGSTGTGSGVNI